MESHLLTYAQQQQQHLDKCSGTESKIIFELKLKARPSECVPTSAKEVKFKAAKKIFREDALPKLAIGFAAAS